MKNLKVSILLALVTALIAASMASAHANLMRSDPAANATLPSAPAQVAIWFTEAIEPGFSNISVLFEDGSTADGGDSIVSPTDPTQLSVSLADSREGTYLVSWRVLSTVDGHITSGSFVFSVGKPIDRSVGTRSGGAVTSPLDMLARALSFIGQAVLVGVMLFRWLVWHPALKSADLEDSLDDAAIVHSRRAVWIAIGLTAAGAALTLLVQSALTDTTIGGWLSTRVGRIWIGRVATLIGLAVLADDLASVGRRKDRSAIALSVAVGWLGLQLLFTTSLTSHSASVAAPPILPIAADWLHLLATALWAGGLVQLAFIVPPVARSLESEDRAWLWLKTVVYFSPIAAIGLGILIVSGGFMSALHIGEWQALLATAYGRAILFKLALAGAAMLIGAYNLFVVKPKLDRAVDEPEAASTRAIQSRFRRLVAIEAGLALAVLASAGILTDLPRSKDPQPAASGETLALDTRAENLDVELKIDPALEGPNTFELRLTQDGRPIADATEVKLRFTYLTRSVGAVEATAAPAEGGAYTADGAYLSLTGDWQIEAIVRRPGAFDAFAAYRVKVGLDGRIEPAGDETIFDSIARWLSIYGLPFGGGVAIALGLIWLLISLKASRNLVSQIALLAPVLIALPIGALSLITFFREATPGLALTNPYLPDEQSLAIGQKLFEDNCAVCHGEAGRGNGPAASSLSVPPPDYANGHLDIHTDGDIFYWIQNGLPRTGSPMPAFKDKLSEDDTWHVVNYVRRLRNLAGDAPSNAPQPAATPSSALQPYTPPSFISSPGGAMETSTTPAAGESAALDLLRRADAAMNALKSMVEKQTIRDDVGGQLNVVFTYAAPDRLRYQVVNGATAIQIGSDDYQLGPDGNWLKNRRAMPFEWPNFYYGKVATEATIAGTDQVGDTAATIVTFKYGGFDFRAWIESASSRIIKLTMDGVGHHMISIYSDFDAAPPIESPIQ